MDYQNFLDSFFEQIAKAGLDISGLPLDHIAYQAATSKEYDQLKLEFSNLGTEVHEAIIGERRVSIFKLAQPIVYKDYAISVLEILEPKAGQLLESGYQHAEFVLNQDFETYMNAYPNLEWDTSSMNREEFSHLKLHFPNGLTLKFLQKPILELLSHQP